MDRLEDATVQPHHKGFPASAVGRRVSELRGLPLTEGGFGTPVLLLREDALEQNLRAMRRFCEQAALSLSPHVKTTMSPEVVARQLDQGAWAVTVATPTQARTLRHLGAQRVLLANQLVDPAAIGWLGAELDRDSDFTAYCYVDSADGVDLLERSLAARGQGRRLPVLVELGVPGGRTGTRTVGEVVRLARLVTQTRHLRLTGVGGFEGIIDVGMQPGRLGEVEGYLLRLRQAADETAGHVSGELVVTAGGSAYVELVRDVFDTDWRAGRPIRVVLRSGCYVTHDSAGYQEYRSLMAHRPDPLALAPALELWARVLSRPEPGLALADFGKRDVGTDAGYPVARYVIRRGGSAVEAAPPLEVVALNDQHAYLKATPMRLQVGDLVGLGVSHPCTTIDKWRLIPIVDAGRRLAGAAQTLF